MLDQLPVEEVLFLDIETVPLVSGYEALTPEWQKLWDDKMKNQVSENTSSAELYPRAGIYAEFGRIIVISAGYLHQKKGEWYYRVKSFADPDEKKLLSDFCQALERFEKVGKKRLCAHNGQEFDFPWIARRLLVHQLELPKVLDIAGAKPWEVKELLLDTLQLWKFGDFKHYTSLALLCALFGIPTPNPVVLSPDESGVGGRLAKVPIAHTAHRVPEPSVTDQPVGLWRYRKSGVEVVVFIARRAKLDRLERIEAGRLQSVPFDRVNKQSPLVVFEKGYGELGHRGKVSPSIQGHQQTSVNQGMDLPELTKSVGYHDGLSGHIQVDRRADVYGPQGEFVKRLTVSQVENAALSAETVPTPGCATHRYNVALTREFLGDEPEVSVDRREGWSSDHAIAQLSVERFKDFLRDGSQGWESGLVLVDSKTERTDQGVVRSNA